MKNHKEINIKLSIAEMLDRIREQLPKRGSLKASYGEAIEWQKVTIELQSKKIQELSAELRRKKVRK